LHGHLSVQKEGEAFMGNSGATVLLVVSAVLMGFLGACTPASEEPAPPAQNESAFPLDVTDQVGRQVRIEKISERIVTLSPSNTEIIYALGLDEKLVGVTEYCDYPEAAKGKPKIGGFSTVDMEKVVEIEPDLILAAAIHEDEVIPQLERFGLTVLALTPKTVEQVLDAIILVGKCAGQQQEAAQLVAEMRGRIKAITDKTTNLTQAERPRVFYVLWQDPLMTVGSPTQIHQLIELAGGTNIARGLDEDYPTLGLETVVAANPQVIIASSGHGEGAHLPYEFALTDGRLRSTDARIEGQLYEIESDLVARSGPRVVDGLEHLAKMIHPEIFGTIE